MSKRLQSTEQKRKPCELCRHLLRPWTNDIAKHMDSPKLEGDHKVRGYLRCGYRFTVNNLIEVIEHWACRDAQGNGQNCQQTRCGSCRDESRSLGRRRRRKEAWPFQSASQSCHSRIGVILTW